MKHLFISSRKLDSITGKVINPAYLLLNEAMNMKGL